MEIEKVPVDHGILVKKSTEAYIPACLRVTFELPMEIGDRFLQVCDLRNRDPDEIVARLIARWTAQEIEKCR